MKQRRRIYYSTEQKNLMWDRWQAGDSLHEIARLFDRGHSSIQGVLSETGGIRPRPRRRSRLALTLAEREEISRGMVAGQSLRSIAVAALVDSAPIIPESSIKTSCFERKLIRTFNLQLPARCPQCADPSRGGLISIYDYLSKTYPQGRFAFASADADLAGVVLYNRESQACGGAGVNIFNYRFSLYALRDRYIGHDWATFLPGGIQHTMTQSDALFLERKFRGVSAAEWLSRINAKSLSHVPEARLIPER